MLSTIGGNRANINTEFSSSLLLYANCLLLLAVFSCAFTAVQRQIERRIGGYEFAFSCSVGKFERVVSESRILGSVKEEEEIEIPVSKWNGGTKETSDEHSLANDFALLG